MTASTRRPRSSDRGRVLDKHERLILRGADEEAFLAAVIEPPEPKEKLVAALKRHCEMVR